MAEHRTHRGANHQYVKSGLITGSQGIYAESATAKHTVGERLCLGDGRVFYYAKNSSTAIPRPGLLVVANCDITEDDSSVTESIGERDVEFTTVGAFGDRMVGGFLVGNTGTGGGQIYKIQDVSASTTSGNSVIHLHDGIQIAFSTASCTAHENIFSEVELSADENAFFLGVPLIAVTASYYFWLQTWGWTALYNTDGLGDADDERELFPGTSGVSCITTAKGALGKQVVGNVAYYDDDQTANEAHLGYLTIWP
jgi:hypothetical protein